MVSLRIKLVAAGVAAVIAVGLNTCAGGQEKRLTGTGTVSVAALRVPVKARQHLEKARQALIAGRSAEYERELAAALAIDPEFGEAYVLRASQEVMAERYDAAIADASTAQRLEPGIPWAAIVHAEACNGLRHYDEAFALLDALKSNEAGTWQAKYAMTRTAVGRGDAVAALQWSKLALDAVPESAMANAILLRANAFQISRRWQEALEQFDKYLAFPGAQPMRAQVAVIRERVQRLITETNNATVAAQ